MDILLILVLLFVAWLGGHALDYVFNTVEKAIKPAEAEEEFMTKPKQEVIYDSDKTTIKTPGKEPARLYLVPSATARH
ncbi:MAG: hypothetical protein WC028_18970 [Candidatus Obscuribacterales bacterium]